MFEVLLANDQLKMSREKGKAFGGFNEGDLTFPPTYKFDIGTNNYDTSKKSRIPSWTDRVLWRDGGAGDVSLLKYDSVGDVRTSDHKPVCASFQVRLDEGAGLVPIKSAWTWRQICTIS